MIALIKNDIRKSLKSKYFWLSVLLIVISCLGYYFIETRYYGSLSSNRIDTFGMFFAGVAFGNTIINILAPMIPAVACICLWSFGQEDFENSLFSNLNKIRNIVSRSISVFIIGGLVFCIGLILYFGICIIFNPNTPGAEIVVNGDFSEIYVINKTLYCLVYILQATTFGSIYAIFAMGILLFTRNIAMYTTIPITVYFCASYIPIAMPLYIKDILFWITPLYTYGLTSISYSEIKSIIELVSVLVLSLLLIYISYRRTNNSKKQYMEVK